MKLILVEVRLIGVQTDMVVPEVLVVIEGALKASYAHVATQA